MELFETVDRFAEILYELEQGKTERALMYARNALTEARFALAAYEDWVSRRELAELAWQQGGAQLLADLNQSPATVEAWPHT